MYEINYKKRWRDSVVVWPDAPHMFDIPASRNLHCCSFSSPMPPPLEEGCCGVHQYSCTRHASVLLIIWIKYSGLWLCTGADLGLRVVQGLFTMFSCLQCLHFSIGCKHVYIHKHILMLVLAVITWPTQLYMCWSAVLGHRSIATFIKAGFSILIQHTLEHSLNKTPIKNILRFDTTVHDIPVLTNELSGLQKRKEKKTTLNWNYKIGRVYGQISNKTFITCTYIHVVRLKFCENHCFMIQRPEQIAPVWLVLLKSLQSD